MKKGKALIFSAPSGAGKTTVVRHLINTLPNLDFSISATTRKKRENEVHGKDYYFVSLEEFKEGIQRDSFLEWEEVYPNVFYGTPKSELERIWNIGNHVVFDVDVEGGVNLKSILNDDALACFIKVQDVEVLRNRLLKRDSESTQSINERLEKATQEMAFESKFDYVLVNNEIDKTLLEAENKVTQFIDQ